MITRLAPFVLIVLACAPAAAQEKPGEYILLLDKDDHPLAGSYRIGPDVKMVMKSRNGGLPGNPVYLDRAFFPAREAEMLAFYNTRHAYSPDPDTADVGETVEIIDRETLLPPLFKDQNPERKQALKLTVSGRQVFEAGGQKLVGKAYRVEGVEPGGDDLRFGDYVYIETLDIVLSAEAAPAIAAVERGTATGSGDFQALYVERVGVIPDFVKCIADTRRTPDYKARAEKQRASVDAFLAKNFGAGQTFWADTALYEINHAMNIYALCPN